MDAARETVAYQFGDFAYDNYSPANADRFLGYMAAMLAAGGSVSPACVHLEGADHPHRSGGAPPPASSSS